MPFSLLLLLQLGSDCRARREGVVEVTQPLSQYDSLRV